MHARIVFMGTPQLARVILHALATRTSFNLVTVVAQPDRPAGRGLELQEPPTKLEARELGIPVLQPQRARDEEFIAHIRDLAPDVIIVAAYGQILPTSLLEIPVRGCLNVHTSLLPRWRGAAPIQWAILEGDPVTGITLMRMDAGLDTGDIVAQEVTPITETDSAGSLHDRLAILGADLLIRTLPDWLSGEITARPQPAEGVTYARKLSRSDGLLDWSRPAVQLWRQVRALNPVPGAFSTISSGEGSLVLKVWDATPVSAKGKPGTVIQAEGENLVIATGDGGLRLTSVQREGRRRVSAREFIAGGLLKPGDILGVAAERQ